jgi:hypothetical protein
MVNPTTLTGIIGRRPPPVTLKAPALQPPSLELPQSYSDWRNDWTHIVAGKFTNSPYSGLLFYEQSTRCSAVPSRMRTPEPQTFMNTRP